MTSESKQPQQQQQTDGRVRRLGRTTLLRASTMFTSRGPGFRRLAQSHAGGTAGDTLVAMALSTTLFFSVPSTQARENVALYLIITLAPFALIGPFLGSFFERFPGAYRGGLVVSSALRAVAAVAMALWLDSFLLFPIAFALLVLSRFHGISRSSVVPLVLDDPGDLISGNAQLARIGVLASAVIIPIGLLGVGFGHPSVTLVMAAVVYFWSALSAAGLSVMRIQRMKGRAARLERKRGAASRDVRLARFATAGVRFLNGFLLLLVAFEFRDDNAGFLDFSALLAAAGLGYFIAAFVTPILDKRISEEPMVVTGLAIEAGAAFIAAQVFGLPAAALLAAAAGFAWGTAKFGFDGLLQATVPEESRGRAFTNAETFFQFAWVIGALIPVLPAIPVGLGLTLAGLLALTIQVIYISAVLVPVVTQRRSTARDVMRKAQDPPDQNILDLM
ncbi:MAG: hypothetical protein U9N84_08075 [Actinomycetota bacterium]|nr:hypothetical protein [Actinomycetota bacterium]